MALDADVLNLFAVSLTVMAIDRLKRAFFGFGLLAVPARLFHEAAHWVVGFALKGGPRRFGALRQAGVGRAAWYHVAAITLAPLLLIPIAWFVYEAILRGPPERSAGHAVAMYAIASLL